MFLWHTEDKIYHKIPSHGGHFEIQDGHPYEDRKIRYQVVLCSGMIGDHFLRFSHIVPKIAYKAQFGYTR